MPLPQSTVDLIFAKLSVAYGHRFLSIWDGNSLDVVKADWAQQLAEVRNDRILWALQNLPERAPDAPTFRALCARMPQLREPMAALPDVQKKPAPAVMRVFAEAIKNEKPSTEPRRICWARSYIAKWTAPGANPTFFERETLLHALRLVERYDAEPVDIEQLKAETQERVESYESGAA